MAVLIIGGGPAGASCAMALAQRGISVAVAEARPFPRNKVCGEYLSPAFGDLIERAAGPGRLLEAGARRVDRLQVFADRRRVIDWAMPSRAWALSRGRLDTLLLQRAGEAGAMVCQPIAVRRVAYLNDRIQADVDGQPVTARCVVHADGIGRHDPAGPIPHRVGIVALKCHLRLPQSLGPVLQLHGFAAPSGWLGFRGFFRGRGWGYFGLVSVEEDLTTLAMVVKTAAVRRYGGNHDELLRAVWPEAATAQRVDDWLSCPVAQSGYLAPGHARSFRIGNAAGAVEPLGGEGIALAVWSGQFLGQRLDPDQPLDAQADLAEAYPQQLRVRRMACLAAAELLSQPLLLTMLRPLLGLNPDWAMRPLYRWTGKPE